MAPSSLRRSSSSSGATRFATRRSSTAKRASQRKTTSCPPSSTRNRFRPPTTWRASTGQTCIACTSGCPAKKPTPPPHPPLSPFGGEGSEDPLSLIEGEGLGEGGSSTARLHLG